MSALQPVPIDELQARGLGLDGSCVRCLTGTDSGCYLVGSWDYHARFLLHLGIEDDVVLEMTRDYPDGTSWTTGYRLCQPCGDESGVKVGLLMHGRPIPTYREDMH